MLLRFRLILANIPKFFRPFDHRSLATFLFLRGDRFVDNVFDCAASQFQRLLSFSLVRGLGVCRTPQRAFHDPADRFGSRRLIRLSRYPPIELSELIRLDPNLNLNPMTSRRRATLFLWYQGLTFHKNHGTKEKSGRQGVCDTSCARPQALTLRRIGGKPPFWSDGRSENA